jgi:ATP-dependent Lon protease
MTGNSKHLPLISLDSTVVYPSTSVLLMVGRKRNIAALEEAQENNGLLIVAAQKDVSSEENIIVKENIQKIGTMCKIKSLSGSKKLGYKVLITGISRFRIDEIIDGPNSLEAIGVIKDDTLNSSIASNTLFNTIKELAREVITLLPRKDDKILSLLSEIKDQDELIYFSASYLKLNVEDMQEILEIENITDKMILIFDYLKREKEVLLLEKDIKSKVNKRITKSQRQLLLREQLVTIKEELGDTTINHNDVLLKKIENSNMPSSVLEIAKEEFKRFTELHPSSADYNVIRNYLDWLCFMPWGKALEEDIDLFKSEEILDQHHFGLKIIKKRILEHLAINKLKGNLKSPIICFVGPPGVGKTSLGKSISFALNRKFIRTSLGGVTDESEIRGHRRTYVGAMPGKIVQALKRAGTNNPVILLDEIDKLGQGAYGDTSSALLEVLDPEQNNSFVDSYLDVPFDLSNVFFIATANNIDSIALPLRDRMEMIYLSSYTLKEKRFIAKKFIIPQTIKDNGLSSSDLKIPDNSIDILIENFTRESGVRELSRIVSSICRATALDILKNEIKPIIINDQKIYQYLGSQKFLEAQPLRKWISGISTGLAWTPVGGQVLYLESIKMKGNGNLKITGQLGEVMKESAELALSFIKAHISELNDQINLEDFDIHLHVPAGAIPKDGPSAGIAILVALTSLISGKIVDRDVGMTGEMTLTGSVLPVGGIKEKVIAAHKAKLKKILIPKQNLKDLDDIPSEVAKDIEFFPVETVNDVLDITLNIYMKNGIHRKSVVGMHKNILNEYKQ